ncbi:hypothetical protein BH10PSE19_BH10PSE19_18950 [soil metagenome]
MKKFTNRVFCGLLLSLSMSTLVHAKDIPLIFNDDSSATDKQVTMCFGQLSNWEAHNMKPGGMAYRKSKGTPGNASAVYNIRLAKNGQFGTCDGAQAGEYVGTLSASFTENGDPYKFSFDSKKQGYNYQLVRVPDSECPGSDKTNKCYKFTPK